MTFRQIRELWQKRRRYKRFVELGKYFDTLPDDEELRLIAGGWTAAQRERLKVADLMEMSVIEFVRLLGNRTTDEAIAYRNRRREFDGLAVEFDEGIHGDAIPSHWFDDRDEFTRSGADMVRR